MAALFFWFIFIACMYLTYKIIDFIVYIFWFIKLDSINPIILSTKIFHWKNDISAINKRFVITKLAFGISEISTYNGLFYISTWYIYKNARKISNFNVTI